MRSWQERITVRLVLESNLKKLIVDNLLFLATSVKIEFAYSCLRWMLALLSISPVLGS